MAKRVSVSHKLLKKKHGLYENITIQIHGDLDQTHHTCDSNCFLLSVFHESHNIREVMQLTIPDAVPHFDILQ